MNSIRYNLSHIENNGILGFEWRFWELFKALGDISKNSKGNFPTLKNLIKFMIFLTQKKNEDLVNWGITILKILSKSTSLLKFIRKESYNQLKILYPSEKFNHELTDLLDSCGYFSDDTIPEIIKLFNKRKNIPLRHFINNLYYKDLTISEDKKQKYIDEISKSLAGLEPKKNQEHSELIQLANKVRSILSTKGAMSLTNVYLVFLKILD
jgi:hypothetical protein